MLLLGNTCAHVHKDKLLWQGLNSDGYIHMHIRPILRPILLEVVIVVVVVVVVVVSSSGC